ncbi:MAG: exo-alpha-sialidase, partial [Chloroflexales bacterium]|nr:exo-alpha-sialidase [Chloroflexales bacterium]
PGQVDILIRIRDKAGNVLDYPRTFFYDKTPPVLNATTAGSFNVTSQPNATILTNLTFEGINVTDDMYRDPVSNRQFWGVWVANSRTQVANPTDPAGPLTWTALAVPRGAGNSFTLANWSLASNLSGEAGTGTYYVYVRFLDGAGNPTDGYLTTEVTVDQVTFPSLHLPVVRR